MENVKFTTQPLETERLILKPLRKEYAEEAFAAWTTDPDVARYVRWSPHASIENTISWLTDNENKIDSPDHYEWGMFLRDSGKLVGSIGAGKVTDDQGVKRYELGYCLAKKFWGRGITSEALSRVFLYLKDDVGLRHFFCCHDVSNPASGTVMRKIGFKPYGTGTALGFDGIKKMDMIMYKLDLEDLE
jgi:ribosomal-protein-alanine N-acetyltransferase